jgi:hypothetical protein
MSFARDIVHVAARGVSEEQANKEANEHNPKEVCHRVHLISKYKMEKEQ